jgi:DHA1 family bicyclomycin/chloramphenicol resistance-like MFS transporter
VAVAALRTDRSQVALLGLASGLSAFGMASVVPSLPLLADALTGDYAVLQWVVSAYLLGLGLAQPVQGWLCDRYGRRPIMLVGFAVFVSASLVAVQAPTLWLLVVARFAQALGVSVATVASRAIVRDTHAPQAATTLSFITAVMGVAPVIAPLLGGLVVDALHWRALFALHAIIGGALWIWIYVQLAESRPASTAQLGLGSTLGAFGKLLRDRGFMSYSLVYCFMSGAAFAFITCGAALYNRLFDLSPARFGVFWAALSVCYAAGAWLAGATTRRVETRAMLIAGAAVSLVGGLLFVVFALQSSASFLGFSVALGLLLVGNGISSPIALAGAVEQRPNLAGTASGLSSALAMLTSMVFAIATGALFDGSAQSIAWLLASP